jgi:uncharacterized membrane protein
MAHFVRFEVDTVQSGILSPVSEKSAAFIFSTEDLVASTTLKMERAYSSETSVKIHQITVIFVAHFFRLVIIVSMIIIIFTIIHYNYSYCVARGSVVG